jgi:hypothetical protein
MVVLHHISVYAVYMIQQEYPCKVSTNSYSILVFVFLFIEITDALTMLCKHFSATYLNFLVSPVHCM